MSPGRPRGGSCLRGLRGCRLHLRGRAPGDPSGEHVRARLSSRSRRRYRHAHPEPCPPYLSAGWEARRSRTSSTHRAGGGGGTGLISCSPSPGRGRSGAEARPPCRPRRSGQARRAARPGEAEEVELDDTTLVDKVESIVFRKHDLPRARSTSTRRTASSSCGARSKTRSLVDALEARGARAA